MEDCLPEGFTLDEPWRLNLTSLNGILDKFLARAAEKKDFIIFKADPKPAAHPPKQKKQPSQKRKKIGYVEIDQEEENKEDGDQPEARPPKKAKKAQEAKV